MAPEQMIDLFIMSATATSLGLHVDGLLRTFSLFIYLTYQFLAFLTFSPLSETTSLDHVFFLF